MAATILVDVHHPTEKGMSVYVDEAIWPLGYMLMCHMLADTPEELFAMADRLGIDRRYFQARTSPHFDLNTEKRALAVKFGAIEIDKSKTVELIWRLRANPEPWRRAARQLEERIQQMTSNKDGAE